MSSGPDFLTLYHQYASEVTDASPDYHAFMGLATLGTILGNNVFYPFGDTKYYPNIWLILIGESTTDHKSTALKISQRLIRKYSQQTSTQLIHPNEFSHESLLKSFHRQPCGAFYIDEFSTWMGILNKRYNEGSKGLFATFYEFDGIYERTLTKATYKVENPAPSILCATTTDWFIDHLQESDVRGGLMVRFLIIPSTRRGEDKSLPPMADIFKRNMILDWFDVFRQIKGACYMLSPAKRIHDEWYHAMRGRSARGVFAPFAGRLQAYLIKFAMLLEINRSQKLKITAKSMREAVNMVEWLYKRMEDLQAEEIVFTPQERDVLKVKRAIRRHDTQQPTRAEIGRLTHLGKWHLDNAIETLLDRQQLAIVYLKSEGKGKKATTTYKLTGEN